MKYHITLISFVLMLLATGCGGDSDTSQPANENISTGRQTIDVYGINKMKYVVKEEKDWLQTGKTYNVNGTTYYLLEGITAQPGQKLTVKLTTISNLPARAMSHNWLLLKPKADPPAFATAAMKAKANNYLPKNKMNLVITQTGLAAPGKTLTTTFTAPEQTGKYDYMCTFPGHFMAGMRGTLTVK